jgi:predicted Na+-dependent transporter
MRAVKIIEANFWLFLIIALVCGLALPNFGKHLNALIIPLLMVLLFLAYLKIDIIEIVAHVRKPIFLLYILLIYLLCIPLLVYFVFLHLDSQLALALAFLSAMPPGIGSPALTDIVEGNTSLSTALSLIAHLISPFTLLFILFFTTGKALHIDAVSLLKTLVLVSFIPLVAAQVIRRMSVRVVQTVNRTKIFYSSITIFLFAFITYIITAGQSQAILTQPLDAVRNLLWLYCFFIFLHAVGYLVAFWRNKPDRIALSVSKAYMNNALAIALAIAFFSPHIAYIIVLSDIPWNTTLGGFKYLLKFLK